ncbi:MAG: hypothetical protein K2K94_08280, partial [Muribaculaceae bacterium]|nr:hypothetical protein [Muribaculaceae bacterium]
DKVNCNDKYDFVILCQSLMRLYKNSSSILPVSATLFTHTDEYDNVKDEIVFLRNIHELIKTIEDPYINEKYRCVYRIYRRIMPEFLYHFENEGFYISTICPDFLDACDKKRL